MIRDKHSASLNALKLTDEIDCKSKQMTHLQSKHRTLQAEINKLDTAAQTQLHAVASQSEAAIDTAQRQLQTVNAQNVEYHKFVKASEVICGRFYMIICWKWKAIQTIWFFSRF